MAASKVLKFFKDRRDVNIHVEPVALRADIGVQAAERIRLRLTESVTVEISEGERLVGRRQSAPAELETESELSDEPATIGTIYRFSEWPGVEDVFLWQGSWRTRAGRGRGRARDWTGGAEGAGAGGGR